METKLFLKTWLPFLLVFLLPWHFLRFSVLGLATNLWEATVLISFLLILPSFRRWRLRQSLLFWLFLALIITGFLIGFVLAADKVAALGIIKGWLAIPLIFIFVVYQTVKDDFTAPVFGLAAATGFLAILALVQYLTHNFITLDGRASAIFSSANQLAMLLLPSLFIIVGYLLKNKSDFLSKSFLVLVGWLGLLAVVLTFSYGAWIALLVAIGTFIFVLWPKSRYSLLALALVGAVVLSVLFNKLMLLLAPSSSAAARLQIWRVACALIKQAPLWGIGLGDFMARYQVLAVRFFAHPLELVVPHAHNFFLQSWLALGLPGLLGFLGLLVLAFKGFIKNAAIFLPALVAWLVQGLFDTTYYQQSLAAIFWLIVLLSLYGRDEKVAHRH